MYYYYYTISGQLLNITINIVVLSDEMLFYLFISYHFGSHHST